MIVFGPRAGLRSGKCESIFALPQVHRLLILCLGTM